jgi:hypothetical protein
MAKGLSNIIVANLANSRLNDMFGLRAALAGSSVGGGFSPFYRIKRIFPQLGGTTVPCQVPADLSFLRYAAMQAGAAIDCAYPLPGFVPTEGAYALTDCEEVLP